MSLQSLKGFMLNIFIVSHFTRPNAIRKRAGCVFGNIHVVNVKRNFLKSVVKLSIIANIQNLSVSNALIKLSTVSLLSGSNGRPLGQ